MFNVSKVLEKVFSSAHKLVLPKIIIYKTLQILIKQRKTYNKVYNFLNNIIFLQISMKFYKKIIFNIKLC